MKAQFTKSNLLTALQNVRAAVGDGTLPILSHVLITPKNGETKITATDLDLRATTTLKGGVEDPTAFTVHADTLLGLVSRVADPEATITITGKPSEGRVAFSANGSQKFRGALPVLAAADFPKEAKTRDDYTFKAKSCELKNALRKVVGIVSREDGRRYLTGVLFELSEKTLTLVSTDSHRLAVSKVSIETDEEKSGEFLVPGRAADTISRALSTGDEAVDISLDAKFVAVDAGNTAYRSNLIAEKFPAYKNIIPKNFESDVTFNRAELIQALRVTGVFTDANNPRVTLTIDKETAKLTTENADKGEGEATVSSEYAGASVAIAFNVAYMLDALSNIDTDKVVMRINGPKNPCLFKSPNGSNYIHIVMPMRA